MVRVGVPREGRARVVEVREVRRADDETRGATAVTASRGTTAQWSVEAVVVLLAGLWTSSRVRERVKRSESEVPPTSSSLSSLCARSTSPSVAEST